MAANYKMEVDQGSDYVLRVVIPADLTGHSFRGQIRKKTSEATIIASFTFEAGTIVENVSTEIFVKLTGLASKDIPMPKQPIEGQRVKAVYLYDIESHEAEASPKRWLEGVIEINPEATK